VARRRRGRRDRAGRAAGRRYGNAQVFGYDSAKAAALSAAVDSLPDLVYEAHSTDFQTETALRRARRDAFPVLKSVRRSLSPSARRRSAWLKSSGGFRRRASGSRGARRAMDADPRHWRPYVEKGLTSG